MIDKDRKNLAFGTKKRNLAKNLFLYFHKIQKPVAFIPEPSGRLYKALAQPCPFGDGERGLHAIGVDAKGVFAVLCGLEVQWHFALLVAVCDGIVVVALRDANLGMVSKSELGQCSALVEAHDSIVIADPSAFNL